MENPKWVELKTFRNIGAVNSVCFKPETTFKLPLTRSFKAFSQNPSNGLISVFVLLVEGIYVI